MLPSLYESPPSYLKSSWGNSHETPSKPSGN
jgi:hypothetical protein